MCALVRDTPDRTGEEKVPAGFQWRSLEAGWRWDSHACTSEAKLFVDFKFFMHNKYGDTPLEETLRFYAEFHIFEGQSVEWSKEYSFQCNCPHFFQWASCHHGLLCTMLCKPSLVVPPLQRASVAVPCVVTRRGQFTIPGGKGCADWVLPDILYVEY